MRFRASLWGFFIIVVCLAGIGPGAVVSPVPVASAAGGPLPGDRVIGPAYGVQNAPVITKGNNGYLAVWVDQRVNPTGFNQDYYPDSGDPGGQTLADIYAARLDARGKLIDTTPIVVSQARWDQSAPDVAWNGQNWLVAWTTRRVADFSYTDDVVGARVSPAGVVLDPEPIIIESSDDINEGSVTLSSDGTNWVAVWFDQGSYFELRGARIAPDGSILDPGGVPLFQPDFGIYPYQWDLAFAGDEFLLVWSALTGSSTNILGQRFTPELQPLDPEPFTISNAVNYQYRPAVASNGTHFFVAWHDARHGSGARVFGSRVSHGGAVLDPRGIDISGTTIGSYPTPDVAWDGRKFVVVWDDYSDFTASLRYAAVTLRGTLVLRADVSLTNAASNPPSITAAGLGSALVIWTDWSGDAVGADNIYTAQIAQDGSVRPPDVISLGAPAQMNPDLVASSDGYLTVFESRVSGDSSLKGQRLDAQGNAIDQEPFFVGEGVSPAVAWNGSMYFIVWSSGGDIYGRRLLPDGTFLDAAPILIMNGRSPDVAAIGDTFLVVGIYSPFHEFQGVYSMRVRASDGATLDPSQLQVGDSFATAASVAPVGDRFVVVYERMPTHDNPRSEILGTFVTLAGEPSTRIALDRTDFAMSPVVAQGSGGALAVWHVMATSGHGAFYRTALCRLRSR